VVARFGAGAYIDEMTSRPCKPDADLKGLWRMLLGTPFPACGIAEDADAASSDNGAAGRDLTDKPGWSAKAKVHVGTSAADA
jgi:hypothetical protein